jgi:hypothetical protein
VSRVVGSSWDGSALRWCSACQLLVSEYTLGGVVLSRGGLRRGFDNWSLSVLLMSRGGVVLVVVGSIIGL